MKKSSANVMWGLVGVVVVLVGLVYLANATGIYQFPGMQTSVVQPTYVTGGTTTPSAVTQTCTGINSLTLSSAARNPLNSSTQYTPAAFRVVGKEGQIGIVGKSDLAGGSIVASGTGTEGSSLTYTSIAVPCTAENFAGEVYVLSNVTYNSGKAIYSMEGTAGNVVVSQPRSTELNFTFRNTELTNTSIPAVSSTETSATAMSAGDTRTGYLDLQVTGNSSFAQYGASDLGIIWTLDTVSSSAFSDNAVSITSPGFVLTQIDCQAYPKTTAVRSANRCWKSEPITTSSGLIRLNWVLNADGGTDPGSSDDPVLSLDDSQYLEDSLDGKIRMGTHTSGGSDVGQTVTQATWNNS